MLIFHLRNLSNEFIIFGGLCGLLVLAFYFIYVLNNPKASIPFIICSSWLVYFEPAPSDILGGLAMLAFVLHLGFYKRSIAESSLTELMLLFFIILNINNVINTSDISYSLRHFFISLYLVAFFLLISKLSDSYYTIRKQLNLYFVPCVITSFALMFGYFAEVLNLDIGILADIIGEERRYRGFFKDSNVAGAFLVLPAIYSLLSVLNQKRKSNLLLLFLFFLSVIGIFLTLSRAAILALIFSMLLVFSFSVTSKKCFRAIFILLIAISTIFTVLLFAPKTEVFQRIYDTQFGIQDRSERIERGLEYIKESPLIGSGMRLNESIAPHDTYFLILTQTGIIGFLLFWTPTIYLTTKLLLNGRHCQNANNKVIILTLGISLLSHAIFGPVIYFLHWRHFWFTLGLSTAAVRLMDNEPNKLHDENIR